MTSPEWYVWNKLSDLLVGEACFVTKILLYGHLLTSPNRLFIISTQSLNSGMKKLNNAIEIGSQSAAIECIKLKICWHNELIVNDNTKLTSESPSIVFIQNH